MTTISLKPEECAALLAIAEKIKRARLNEKGADHKTRRREFIDANPHVPQRELARMMRQSGLYSLTTFLGDIETQIVKRREQTASAL